MIVKVQRPLSSNAENPPALVYDQGRTFQKFLPMTGDLAALIGHEPKAYFEAQIVAGLVVLGKRIPPQPW